jgi:YgiT-type zinc finger domain-containing protein
MKCGICGGRAKAGQTMVSVDTGAGIVVIRDVPAHICTQCGEDWLTDHSAAEVEKIVQRAKREKTQLEVVALAAV